MNPKLPLTYNNRGNVYFVMEMYPEAVYDYTRALQLNPELAIAYSGRGFVYEKIGMLREALQDFKNFIQFAPESYTEYKDEIAERIKALEAKTKQGSG